MPSLKLTFLDVQHGSACHIQTPKNKHILFDLGTGDFDASQAGIAHSPIKYLRNTLGVSQVDAVVITHPHADHIADIENFDLVSPRCLWRPKHISEQAIRAGNKPGDSAKIDRYLEINARYNGGITAGTSPLDPAVNGCTDSRIWLSKQCPETNLNNHSMAAVFSYAGTKFLLTGDQEKGAWDELFQDPSFVAAIKNTDILLASHHGRESGYHEDLFLHMNPCLTIISDGPQGATCVADKYRAKTTGWGVWKRQDGSQKDRYCLTTRSDGTIQVTCTAGTPNTRLVTVK